MINTSISIIITIIIVIIIIIVITITIVITIVIIIVIIIAIIIIINIFILIACSREAVKKGGLETFCPATKCPRTYFILGQNVALVVCYDGCSWVFMDATFCPGGVFRGAAFCPGGNF